MKYQTISGVSPEYKNTITARLLNQVEQSPEADGCWSWSGPVNSGGYGTMVVNGRSQLAHRISFELFNGPIGRDLFVCHKCDNRQCLRPDHLFLGDNSDNMQDASQKGRLNIAARKMTDDAVRNLRFRFDRSKHTIATWANELGVSTTAVSLALRGKTYRQAGGPIFETLVPNAIDDRLFSEVKELYKSGVSGMKIASQLNIDKSSVYRILKDQQRVN